MRLDRDALARRAAHLAALGGAFVAGGAIALTWASQEVAVEDGFGTWTHVAVTLAATLLGPTLLAAAAAVALQRLRARIGRALFAMGLGGALGALAVPLVMGTVGAPRGLICIGFLAALAALGFGLAAGEKKPRWSFVATLPLVVTSLVSGDYGEPWMKIRTDTGRRSRVDHAVWTSQGVFTASHVTRTKARMAIDRHRTVPFGRKQKGTRKPRFTVLDLPFLLNASKDERGPVLVVHSGAGRSVEAALAYRHPHVDAIEHDRRVVEQMFYDRYVELMNGLYLDPRVTTRVGRVRDVLPRLPTRYEHILVLEKMRVDHAAPRLITRQGRMFTVAAIKDYLSHLRPGGTLFLEVPIEGGPAAIRGAMAALPEGSVPEEQIVSCQHQEYFFVLVSSKKLSAGNRQKLIKKCKRSRFGVEYPLPEIRRGRRDYAAQEAERQTKLAALDAAQPAVEGRPFLRAPPAFSALRSELVGAIRGLQPMPEAEPKPKKGAEPEHVWVKPPSPAGLSAAAALTCLGLLLVGLVIPTGGAARGAGGAPVVLRLSLPGFGFALATCTVALVDGLVEMLGSGLSAWTLVIPAGLAGVGAGRLVADALDAQPRGLARAALFGGAGAAVWILIAYATLEGLTSGAGLGFYGQAAIAAVASGLTGALLGLPLALALKMMNGFSRPPVAWGWAMHLAGWGLGGAVAALAVHYVGVPALWLIGLGGAVVGIGLLVAAASSRRRSAGAIASVSSATAE
jgi:spermidine synthase